MKKQVELSITHNGKDVVAYPYTKKEHVQFENGMNIDEFVGQDIATPTITHDTTAIKVGVGDSDVSSSVVDSTVNMTIKGQTYQNILPEPTLRNEMQGKSMQRLNEGYDSIETVDGVSKSAILKGQTLVNLVGSIKANTGAVLSSDSTKEVIKATASGSSWNQINVKLIHLKPNTNYIVMFDKVVGEFENGYATAYDGTSGLSGVSPLPHVSGNNYSTSNFFVVRTRENHTADNVSFRFHLNGTDTNVGRELSIEIHGLKIMEYQEGMENWDVPYFEGMSSCKMPVLQTIGRNLLPTELSSNFEHKTVNGQQISNIDLTTFLKRGVRYVVKLATSKAFKIATFWSANSNNADEVLVSHGTISANNNNTLAYFTLPINDKSYYMFVNEHGEKHSNFISDISQLVAIEMDMGKAPTTIEPYKTNILSCQLAPLNQTMFEQGTFAETTPPNTQSYEQIKLGSEHLYTTRIRTKGTYKVVKGATYEVQLNDGYGIYVCYCKNGLYSATVNRWLDGTSTFTVPNDCDEMFFAIRKTDNTTIVPSDYPHIGLRIHQEVVLRSLPNGIKDTLNLNTGEYVQRIGEVVVDGSNDERWFLNQNLGDGTYHQYASVNNLVNAKKVLQQTVVSDKLMSSPNESSNNCIWIYDGGAVVIHSSLATANELKTWLSQNPITIQYELATPVVKTVDLSSHGNWEKVVLDGDENWQHESNFAHNNLIEFKLTIGNGNIVSVISDRFATGGNDVERIACTAHRIYIRILKSKVSNLDEFKIWLQQNPTTVWYQTTTTQDNSIREMLSFANGHLQVSSEVENSLLPSVWYEIPTKNSYHMDLMKTNTLYTMKAKTVSGTFTIDGASYNVNTNGTFTTPTLMTDKLLIMSNKTNEEVMLLEGNVIDKTIPYFKGIKSAFEGEDKIEVLSTGKNLISLNNIIQGNLGDQAGWENTITNDSIISKRLIQDGGRFACGIKIYVKPSTTYTLSFEHYRNGALRDGALIYVYNNSGLWEKILAQGEASNLTFTTKPETEYIVIGVNYGHNISVGEVWETKNIQLEESSAPSSCEPYKSNTTKIPLLSPLRSLPNGICDELIIDRLNHKAKLIQRIGYEVLNENTAFSSYPTMEKEKTLLFQTQNANPQGASTYCISDQFIHGTNLWNSSDSDTEAIMIGGGEGNIGKRIDFRISKAKVSTNNVTILQDYLSKEPITVLYQLNIPIITEIDLEGYPYIYKDGHIFLNSDIAPTTQITYSINQAQQIESANENLQRHEKEISHLQKLIAQYIQVEYESTLLSLKI